MSASGDPGTSPSGVIFSAPRNPRSPALPSPCLTFKKPPSLVPKPRVFRFTISDIETYLDCRCKFYLTKRKYVENPSGGTVESEAVARAHDKFAWRLLVAKGIGRLWKAAMALIMCFTLFPENPSQYPPLVRIFYALLITSILLYFVDLTLRRGLRKARPAFFDEVYNRPLGILVNDNIIVEGYPDTVCWEKGNYVPIIFRKRWRPKKPTALDYYTIAYCCTALGLCQSKFPSNYGYVFYRFRKFKITVTQKLFDDFAALLGRMANVLTLRPEELANSLEINWSICTRRQCPLIETCRNFFGHF